MKASESIIHWELSHNGDNATPRDSTNARATDRNEIGHRPGLTPDAAARFRAGWAEVALEARSSILLLLLLLLPVLLLLLLLLLGLG